MAAAKSDIDVSAILASARKHDLQFAMLQSKDGCVLQAHKSKSADAMRKAAKSLGGGAKGAWGKMRLNGKVLVLTCDVAPPGNFAKEVKKFFSDAGHNLRIEFVDASEAESAAVNAVESAPTKLRPGAQIDRARKPERDRQPADGDQNDAVSGDEDEEEAESIADMLGTARKRAVNFAWLTGSDEMVFRGHRKKKCDALVKAAKQAGGGPRGAWGQMSVSGKVITLVCPEAPPGTFERLARQQLKSEGLQYKIEIVVPNGDPPTVTDGAITDAGAPHGSDPVGTDNGAAAQNLDGVQARYRDVFERIKPFLATGDKAAKVEIKKTLGAYREAVLRRDVAAATAVLDALERQATPEPEPNVQDSGQASSPASPIRQIVSDAERRGKVVTKTPPHNQEGNALYYEAIEPVELHVRIRARAETEAEPVE